MEVVNVAHYSVEFLYVFMLTELYSYNFLKDKPTKKCGIVSLYFHSDLVQFRRYVLITNWDDFFPTVS